MPATHNTDSNYVSLLQPTEKANAQCAESTHIFDDNLSCRQLDLNDFYKLFIRIPYHQDHGGTTFRRRCRWEASFGDASMSFGSRHSRQQTPAKHKFVGPERLGFEKWVARIACDMKQCICVQAATKT